MNALSLAIVLCLALLSCSVEAFLAPRIGARAMIPSSVTQSTLTFVSQSSTSSSMSLAAKKSKVTAEDLEKYWQGDWVCADCGYIYDRDFDGDGLWFEEQKRGFICPQCSAPRKRYAKKVGDQWGVTNDGGDLPIYAGTLFGLALTVWFTFFVVPTL